MAWPKRLGFFLHFDSGPMMAAGYDVVTGRRIILVGSGYRCARSTIHPFLAPRYRRQCSRHFVLPRQLWCRFNSGLVLAAYLFVLRMSCVTQCAVKRILPLCLVAKQWVLTRRLFLRKQHDGVDDSTLDKTQIVRPA